MLLWPKENTLITQHGAFSAPYTEVGPFYSQECMGHRTREIEQIREYIAQNTELEGGRPGFFSSIVFAIFNAVGTKSTILILLL